MALTVFPSAQAAEKAFYAAFENADACGNDGGMESGC